MEGHADDVWGTRCTDRDDSFYLQRVILMLRHVV